MLTIVPWYRVVGKQIVAGGGDTQISALCHISPVLGTYTDISSICDFRCPFNLTPEAVYVLDVYWIQGCTDPMGCHLLYTR